MEYCRTVGNQIGQVLIKANKEKLIEHLIDERDTAVDAHYADDFLLMYRVFITDPTMIFEKLVHWFAEATLRDRVRMLSYLPFAIYPIVFESILLLLRRKIGMRGRKHVITFCLPHSSFFSNSAQQRERIAAFHCL